MNQGHKKNQQLDELQKIIDKNILELRASEDKIKGLIHDASQSTDREYSSKNESLQLWVQKRVQYTKKVDLLNRLKLRINLSYTGDNSTAYFIRQLNQIIERDALGPSPDPELILYVRHLIYALGSTAEATESPVEFIKDFIQKTSPTDPATSARFKFSRDYTNGSESIKAHGADSESVGDLLEASQTLKGYDLIANSKPQLQKPILKPAIIEQSHSSSHLEMSLKKKQK